MSYSDYNHRVSGTNHPLQTNTTETPEKTAKNFPKASDPKTVEVSQPIFENSQLTRSTNSTINEHEIAHPLTNAEQNLPPTPAKTDTVGTPILVTSNGENRNISKFDKMDENQLLKALTKSLSSEDLAKISARFEELDEHVAVLADKAQTDEELNKISARLDVLDKVAEKLEEQVAKQVPQETHIVDRKEEDVATVAPVVPIDIQKIDSIENYRVLSGTTLKHVRTLAEANGDNVVKIVGNRLEVQGREGAARPGMYYDEVTGQQIDVREIRTMTEEEVQRFREAYAAHFATLNQNITQEETQNKREAPQQIKPTQGKEITDIKDEKKQENTQAKQRDIFPSDISATTGKDIRAANQRRIEEFIQYMDKKLERIKAEVNKHELNQTNIQREELNVNDSKINGEYQQLRKLHNEGRIDIPLSTLNKFFKLDQTIQQLTRMVPRHTDDSNTYEAIAEAKVMRKEIMNFVRENISQSGNVPRYRGEAGDKNPAPAA